MIEILHHLIYVYGYIYIYMYVYMYMYMYMYMESTTRAPRLLVHGVYTRSCRVVNISSKWRTWGTQWLGLRRWRRSLPLNHDLVLFLFMCMCLSLCICTCIHINIFTLYIYIVRMMLIEWKSLHSSPSSGIQL